MQKLRPALTSMIALPLAGALLLAGCSGGSTPEATGSTTTTSPKSPSSTSKATLTPNASHTATKDPNSSAALRAAVTAYAEASEKAAFSLKTDALRKVFATGCIVCERDVARVEGWAKSGYTVEGARARWTTPTIASRNANGVTIMRVMASTEAGRLKDATGKTIETFSPSPTKSVYFSVRTVKGRAIVIGIDNT